MTNFNNLQVGDRIEVWAKFTQNNVEFLPGTSGVVKGFLPDLNTIAIEWDFEAPPFHACEGFCLPKRGFFLYKKHDFMELVKTPGNNIPIENPLPEDPQLRAICIKTKLMEGRFQRNQLMKELRSTEYGF